MGRGFKKKFDKIKQNTDRSDRPPHRSKKKSFFGLGSHNFSELNLFIYAYEMPPPSFFGAGSLVLPSNRFNYVFTTDQYAL